MPASLFSRFCRCASNSPHEWQPLMSARSTTRGESLSRAQRLFQATAPGPAHVEAIGCRRLTLVAVALAALPLRVKSRYDEPARIDSTARD